MPSISRTNGVRAAGAAVKAAPNNWQFVNVMEPKRRQDKAVISIVRAHAMRNVRRKQRSETTNSGTTAGHCARPSSNDEAITDWPMTVHEISSEPLNLGEAELRVLEHFMRGTYLTGTPKSLVGDGVWDPFNAAPFAGCDKYISQVLNHFASVMALNCLPVDQSKGQNTLTKKWLPYALQDSTLFLATLTFAEVHLEILSGNHKSRKLLLHKGYSIKAINKKLGDPEHALTNETIGAVAMLAAMEAILGNYKELRIHLNGLQRMVYMRGGLQCLGWDGLLHMFISWYFMPLPRPSDLLSSSMIAHNLRYEPSPLSLLIDGSLPHYDPIFPELGLSIELCGEIATCFQNIRRLTQILNSWDKSETTVDIMSFSKTRMDIFHRLLSFANQKPVSEMTNLDYHVETCRLAALMYIKVALHTYSPLCASICTLKNQLINLIKQGEARYTISVGAHQQPHSITWALFVGGILSRNKTEEEWFAQRLAKGIRASGVETWAQMEDRLRQICWLEI